MVGSHWVWWLMFWIAEYEIKKLSPLNIRGLQNLSTRAKRERLKAEIEKKTTAKHFETSHILAS
jgi:hypothetical protein